MSWVQGNVRLSSGLNSDHVTLSEAALNSLNKSYCRESGVRNLRKHIEKIYRKVAFKVVHDKENNIRIDEANLADYVGKPVFSSEKMYPDAPAGVALGLAWTSMGGSTLYIETLGQVVKEAGTGGALEVTGNLGDVMKESIKIAGTFAKVFLSKLDQSNEFFSSNK